MNLFSGVRSVFDAADALIKRIKRVPEPDGVSHATLARGLVDVTGKVVATADGGAGLPKVLVSPTVAATAGNLAAFDAAGNLVDSGSASAGASATAAAASAVAAAASAATLATSPIPFHATVTLTSAAAAAGVTVLADGAVAAGKKVYVTGFEAVVNGATAWATTATVALKDSSGTGIFNLAVAALTANAELRPGSANVTSLGTFKLGTGGTAAKGLVIAGDANGTGSDLVITVWGFIK